jgi:hypothetical protein
MCWEGGVKVRESQFVFLYLVTLEDEYTLIHTRDTTALLCKAVCGWLRVVDDNATFLLCQE